MFTLVCGILNILTDFLCLFLPVPMIWSIQRPKKQRIAILAMFAVGIFTCMAGIARTIFADITLRKTYDITWWLYPLHLATALEIDIGLVSLLALLLSSTSTCHKHKVVGSLYGLNTPYTYETLYVLTRTQSSKYIEHIIEQPYL